jgi:hypothetical protein
MVLVGKGKVLHVYVYLEVVWSCKRGAPNSRLKMN